VKLRLTQPQVEHEAWAELGKIFFVDLLDIILNYFIFSLSGLPFYLRRGCEIVHGLLTYKNISIPLKRIISHLKSYFFCELKSHEKFQNPEKTPSGRKVIGSER
jgi:hypothetical protein